MRPTIQEIAAMPFPASREAVRRWLDPDWCRFEHDAEPREVRVSVDYEVRREECVTITVMARHAEEAKELACEAVREMECGAAEIHSTQIYEPYRDAEPMLPLGAALH